MNASCLVWVAPALLACVDLGDEPWEPAPAGPPPGVFPAGPTGGEGAAPPPQGGGGVEAAGGAEAPSGGAVEPAGPTCPHADGRPLTHDVVMVSNSFRPPLVLACVGDTVRWTNRDSKEHTVVTGSPEHADGYLNSGKIYLGGTFEHTFEAPGEYLYYCSTHKKKMRDAGVVVE